jgi:hypothetical protein
MKKSEDSGTEKRKEESERWQTEGAEAAGKRCKE